jgi:hypothetical protein
VVAANIFPSVLIELAPDLAAAVRRGGVLVASGSVVGARRGGRRRRLRGGLRLGGAALAGRLGRDGVQEAVVCRRSMQRSVVLDNTRLAFHAIL